MDKAILKCKKNINLLCVQGFLKWEGNLNPTAPWYTLSISSSAVPRVEKWSGSELQRATRQSYLKLCWDNTLPLLPWCPFTSSNCSLVESADSLSPLLRWIITHFWSFYPVTMTNADWWNKIPSFAFQREPRDGPWGEPPSPPARHLGRPDRRGTLLLLSFLLLLLSLLLLLLSFLLLLLLLFLTRASFPTCTARWSSG